MVCNGYIHRPQILNFHTFISQGEAFTTEHAVTALFQAPSPVYIEAKINANNESVGMVNGQLIFPVVYTEYLTKNVIRFGDGKSKIRFISNSKPHKNI